MAILRREVSKRNVPSKGTLGLVTSDLLHLNVKSARINSK